MSLIPIVQGGHSTASGFDTTLIGNSVWFDSGDYFSQDSAASDSGRKEAIFSTWLQRTALGAQGMMMSVNGSNANDYLVLDFQSDDTLRLLAYSTTILITTQVFRDIGWYHILVTIDTSQNNNDSQKIFVNGEEVTSFSTRNNFGSSADIAWGRNATHLVNSSPTSVGSNQMIGYMAQTALITDKSFQQGDYSITDFVDAFTIGTNGSQFVPKKNADIATIVGAGGNNSFLLTYENSSDLGNDGSSKNNDFTANSMGSANQSSNTPSKMYAQWNAIQHPFPTTSSSLVAPTLTEGNLRAAISSGNRGAAISSMTIPAGAGKFAAKFTVNTIGGIYPVIGVYDVEGANAFTNGFTATSDSVGLRMDGQKYVDGSSSSYGSSVSATNTVEVELDMDNNTVEFLINGSAQGTISKTFSGRVGFIIQDGTSSGGIDVTAEFDYTPNDSNFLTLNTANLTAPTHFGIDQFNAVNYAGNGTAISSGGKAVTSAGFQPDWVWIKDRDATSGHILTDSVRGATKDLRTHLTSLEGTNTEMLSSFDSDGFTVGSNANVNASSNNIISWNWKAGGAAASNGTGSITSSVSVATPGHFSIVGYQGNSTNAATVGHSLGGAPELIIFRGRGGTGASSFLWRVFSTVGGAGKYLRLNDTTALQDDTGYLNNTLPNETVFTLGTDGDVNNSNYNYVAYCFRSVPGVCKVGRYTGNGDGSTGAGYDGPYISLGFKPKFILVKRTDSGNSWILQDTSRHPLNPVDNYLQAESNSFETATSGDVDFLSDAIKIRTGNGNAWNANGGNYLILAMADIAGGGTAPPIFGR